MAYTVQGFLMIDADVAALNNAGKDASSPMDNAVATKKIYKGQKAYAYVSGQAWRYWWRETLKREFGWDMSPVVREKKIAFTEANPIIYPDDDIFGYMRAAKEETTDGKGKKKSTNITLTRVSPLKNSALISISPTGITQNWSAMTRQEGDAVPFGKDEYCATMKGMFSIALEQAGTFADQNRTGFKNLNETLKKLALEHQADEIDDPFAKDAKGDPLKLYRLSKEVRQKRILESIKALEVISGGAMQTTNMGDVTPKLIVLATLNGGNHPFSHLAQNSKTDRPEFSVPALKQVVGDYADRIIGQVFIGRRMGFMDELEEGLQEYAKDEKIFYGSVNEAIREYVKQLEKQIP
ncbi:type I-B CRISPR-associated protein Cas7/Cst2/Dev R [Desulfonema ishimotonii]|uniref:Type I-B CRISPR-associated protein Cas7/Cst2/Dev R n=1 Tax=Desulfonema ishimotonii TaxID=45657 RepID=A0A401FUL2_9BACT|nr:type I-B CRISPR-associated protein Cas7/Cst2/DevR [Desulfonema ishimotonii]GBC60649.1 type I-B CRISPR-associated protein Cas7/Cst2/Dev R [Desulfonema ishimotonii]